MEIERLDVLREVLERNEPLGGLRLQDLDLHGVEHLLLERTDLGDLVVLGGQLSPHLTVHLVRHGAIVFPSDPHAPLDVYRSHLYTADELYAGLTGPGGYPATLDGRAHTWTLDRRSGRDAYATMLRAIHDQSITDALDEVLDGLPVVGVMGGHSAQRGSAVYAAAARLGLLLADAGLVVATGGGPGAMEAANLGARSRDRRSLERDVRLLAAVPSFQPDVGAWARIALRVRDRIAAGPARPAVRSIGIPTWFYGHEPPNVFGEGIAKYFSNALREDGLLARCTAGIVVLPGEAGTVQEVFQAATRLYYRRTGEGGPGAMPPLVLVGRHHWERVVPAWPLACALAGSRPMGDVLHLVDTVDEAAALLAPG